MKNENSIYLLIYCGNEFFRARPSPPERGWGEADKKKFE
jgi:hypothetical protein